MIRYIRLFLLSLIPLKKRTIICCSAACWSSATCRSVCRASVDLRWKPCIAVSPTPHLLHSSCTVTGLPASVLTIEPASWPPFNLCSINPSIPTFLIFLLFLHPSCVYTHLICAKNKPLLVGGGALGVTGGERRDEMCGEEEEKLKEKVLYFWLSFTH